MATSREAMLGAYRASGFAAGRDPMAGASWATAPLPTAPVLMPAAYAHPRPFATRINPVGASATPEVKSGSAATADTTSASTIQQAPASAPAATPTPDATAILKLRHENNALHQEIAELKKLLDARDESRGISWSFITSNPRLAAIAERYRCAVNARKEAVPTPAGLKKLIEKLSDRSKKAEKQRSVVIQAYHLWQEMQYLADLTSTAHRALKSEMKVKSDILNERDRQIARDRAKAIDEKLERKKKELERKAESSKQSRTSTLGMMADDEDDDFGDGFRAGSKRHRRYHHRKYADDEAEEDSRDEDEIDADGDDDMNSGSGSGGKRPRPRGNSANAEMKDPGAANEEEDEVDAATKAMSNAHVSDASDLALLGKSGGS